MFFIVTAQKYRYNGQEWQDELGLNMTAMDFRQYDNAIGRFVARDPLAELSYSQTPYHFANNNAVNFSDSSGLYPVSPWILFLLDLYVSCKDCAWSFQLNEVLITKPSKQQSKNGDKKKSKEIDHYAEFDHGGGGCCGGFGGPGGLSDGSAGVGFGSPLSPLQQVKMLNSAITAPKTISENRFNAKKAIQLKEVVIRTQKGYSGNLIFGKTWLEYMKGRNTKLIVNTDALNFSNVTQQDIKTNGNINLASPSKFGLNAFTGTALALGNVYLEPIGNNMYSIKKDTYDFDIRENEGMTFRNIATGIAGMIHGGVYNNFRILSPLPSYQKGYDVEFVGAVYIKS